MDRNPSNRVLTLRRDLRAIVLDGAAYSVMVGIGETYLPALVLALAMGSVASGLVTTVPMLAGALLQLASPWFVRRMGSRRRWVVLSAALQAVCMLSLVGIAIAGEGYGWLVFVAASFYWGTSLAGGPAWNSWIQQIVPKSIRAKFFANRVLATQLGVIAGFVLGGVALQWGSQSEHLLSVFAALFAVAAISRFVSSALLAMQSEPDRGRLTEDRVGPLEVARRLRSDASGTGVILIYLLSTQMAVYIAAPFYNPYMLDEVKFSYLEYMILIAAAYLGRILSIPWLAKLAKKAGAHRLMVIGGLAVMPLGALWLVSDSFWYILAIQVIAGVCWGTYELAMLLIFFEAIPHRKRTSVLTLHNLANAISMVVGSLLGAMLFRWLGEHVQAYLTIFAFSTVARGVACLLLLKLPQYTFEPTPVAVDPVALRPSAGSIDRPILPSIADELGAEIRNRDA